MRAGHLHAFAAGSVSGAPRGVARRPAERGFTLTELMVSLAVSMFVIAGAMLMIIAAARSGRGSQERSDLQRGGRAALTLLTREIENAGLGLPRRLAFAEGSNQTVTVAGLDFLQEWTVSSTSGDTSAGTVTLTSGTPYPDKPGDTDLAAGIWLFLYQNTTMDSTNGGNSGHGLLQLGAARQKGDGNIQLSIGHTTWTTQAGATGQVAFNLDDRLPSTPHAIVLLRAHTASFRLDTSIPDHKYLAVSENGQGEDPVVQNVDTFQLGYYVDANCDGQTDDRDGDGVIGWADTYDTPFQTRVAPCDPAGTTEVQVTAVEVRLTLHSDAREPSIDDPSIQDFRRETFGVVIPTRNVSTTAKDYIFIDNSGLCTRNGGC